MRTAALRDATADTVYSAVEQPDGTRTEVDDSGVVLQRLSDHKIDAVVAVGGDDSLTIANELHRKGLRDREDVAAQLQELNGQESCNIVPGHLLPGDSPTPLDRTHHLWRRCYRPPGKE